jgi:hypothetical protein
VLARRGGIPFADDPAHEELRIHTEFAELSPRPQRKVLAVAAPAALEGARLLPDIAIVELFASDTYSQLFSQSTMSSMLATGTALRPSK